MCLTGVVLVYYVGIRTYKMGVNFVTEGFTYCYVMSQVLINVLWLFMLLDVTYPSIGEHVTTNRRDFDSNWLYLSPLVNIHTHTRTGEHT